MKSETLKSKDSTIINKRDRYSFLNGLPSFNPGFHLKVQDSYSRSNSHICLLAKQKEKKERRRIYFPSLSIFLRS